MITTVQQGAKFGTLEGKEYPKNVERPWKDRIHVFLIESNQMRMIKLFRIAGGRLLLSNDWPDQLQNRFLVSFHDNDTSPFLPAKIY
jgi:hypothetical protein